MAGVLSVDWELQKAAAAEECGKGRVWGTKWQSGKITHNADFPLQSRYDLFHFVTVCLRCTTAALWLWPTLSWTACRGFTNRADQRRHQSLSDLFSRSSVACMDCGAWTATWPHCTRVCVQTNTHRSFTVWVRGLTTLLFFRRGLPEWKETSTDGSDSYSYSLLTGKRMKCNRCHLHLGLCFSKSSHRYVLKAFARCSKLYNIVGIVLFLLVCIFEILSFLERLNILWLAQKKCKLTFSWISVLVWLNTSSLTSLRESLQAWGQILKPQF